MDPHHDEATAWSRARNLFLDLADVEPAARAVELDRIGAEDPALRAWVERLLAQDDGEEEPASAAPRRFGPYETLRPIATGGMGEVHLARRVDGAFEREVAIKLLRPGLANEELVQRFLRERRTLASLDHEYVAKLLDGGTAGDGQPFLVMEYVDGLPLTEYARRHALDLRARLRLLERVVEAVAHAHAQGVVHRDLKPGNILVRADGTPRLLDFGIARATEVAAEQGDPLTRTGMRLFTPEYGAPEQVRGEEATAATDVFALGVLAYELLTERGPWPDGPPMHELERAILEREPTPPSRLRPRTTGTGTTRRALAGDLDTIVLTCLAKRPGRRYADAAALGADLARHRSGRPIVARRTSVAGRVARYARRQPWRAAGLGALVLATAAATFAWRAEQRSERRRFELERSVASQVDSSRLLREQGRLDDARAELEQALTALDALTRADRLRAEVLGQLAVTANHAGDFPAALERIERADSVLARAGEADPELSASLMNSRSYALAASGRDGEAWEAAEAALAHCRAHLAPGHDSTLDALLEVSAQQRGRGEAEAGLATMDDAVAEARSSGDPRREALGRVLNSRGLLLARMGRHEDALASYEEALAVLGWHFGEGHASIAQLRENIGASYYRLERLDEAIDEHRRALETFLALDDAAKVADSHEYVGRAHFRAKRYDEAREAFDASRAMRAGEFGERSAEARQSEFWVGYLLHFQGAHEEAGWTLERLLDDELWDGGLAGELRAEAERTLAVIAAHENV